MEVFLFLHVWYTDSLSRMTFAVPGRLGLPLGLPVALRGIQLKNLVLRRQKALESENIRLYRSNDIEILPNDCQENF